MAQLQQPLLRLLAVTSGATDDDVALQGARTELDGVGRSWGHRGVGRKASAQEIRGNHEIYNIMEQKS